VLVLIVVEATNTRTRRRHQDTYLTTALLSPTNGSAVFVHNMTDMKKCKKLIPAVRYAYGQLAVQAALSDMLNNAVVCVL